MGLFLNLLVVGITNGAIYALIALGYTMVYGIIELINFAHGDIFMLGTFMVITVLGVFGITSDAPPQTISWSLVGLLALACIGSMLFCAILGVVIERIAYRPLRNAPRLAPLISAIGVSLVLEDSGKLWKGNTNVSFPTILFGQLSDRPSEYFSHRYLRCSCGCGAHDYSPIAGNTYENGSCYACGGSRP